MSLTDENQQRGLKDFLQLYNTITGFCFDKCISNFNSHSSNPKEVTCVDVCTDNYIQFNQRLMFNFMDHQERRKREQEYAAVELAAKEAAAASESAGTEESIALMGGVESGSLKPETDNMLLHNSNIQSAEDIQNAMNITHSNGLPSVEDSSKATPQYDDHSS